MIIQTSFQGIVGVQVDSEQPLHKIVISSEDDVSSICDKFLNNSPFNEEDRAKISARIKDVQLEVCKLELAYMKKCLGSHTSKQFPMSPLEGVSTYHDSFAQLAPNKTENRLVKSAPKEKKQGVNLTLEVPNSNTSVRVLTSGRRRTFSINESKLEEHINAARLDHSFSKDKSEAGKNFTFDVVEGVAEEEEDPKELYEESDEDVDVYNIFSDPTEGLENIEGLQESVASSLYKTQAMKRKEQDAKDFEFLHAAAGETEEKHEQHIKNPNIESLKAEQNNKEFRRWLESMASPRRNNAEPFFK